MKKKILFSTYCVGSYGYPCEEKKEAQSLPHTIQIFNPKLVRDLEVKAKPMKEFYNKKIYLEVGHSLLDMTQQ